MLAYADVFRGVVALAAVVFAGLGLSAPSAEATDGMSGGQPSSSGARPNPAPDYQFYRPIYYDGGPVFGDNEVRNSSSVFALGCVGMASRVCGVYELGSRPGTDRFVGSITGPDEYDYPDLVGATESDVYYFGGKFPYSLHAMDIESGEAVSLGYRPTHRFVSLGTEAIVCGATDCYRTDGTRDGTVDFDYEGTGTFPDGRLLVYNYADRVSVSNGAPNARVGLFRCSTSECDIDGGQLDGRYYFTVSEGSTGAVAGLWSTDGTREGLRKESIPAGLRLVDVEILEDSSGSAIVFTGSRGDVVVDREGISRLTSRAGVESDLRAFDSADGSVWLGSDEDLVEYVPQTGATTHFPAWGGNWGMVVDRTGLAFHDGADPTWRDAEEISRLYRFQIGSPSVGETCRLTNLRVPRVVERRRKLEISAVVRTRFQSGYHGSCRSLKVSVGGRVVGTATAWLGDGNLSLTVWPRHLKVEPGKRKVTITAPTNAMHQRVPPQVRTILFE